MHPKHGFLPLTVTLWESLKSDSVVPLPTSLLCPCPIIDAELMLIKCNSDVEGRLCFPLMTAFCSRLASHGICTGQHSASSAEGREGTCTAHQFHWSSDGMCVPLLANLKIQGLGRGENELGSLLSAARESLFSWNGLCEAIKHTP